eukprot:3273099-Pleurochrysis_carterae.AAC.3
MRVRAQDAAKEEAKAMKESSETELQRAKEGGIQARVREEEAKRVQAEQKSRTLRGQLDSAQQQLSARSTKLTAEKQELIHLRSRCMSGMPMTSTSAERLFALGRAHDVRAGASRDETRARVILGHADGTAA